MNNVKRGSAWALVFLLLTLLPWTSHAATPPPLPGAEVEAKAVPELDIMETGTIAGLKIGSTEADVLKAIPGKFLKGEDIVWEAIGEAVQEWQIPDDGIEVNMISEKVGGPKSVYSIRIKAPSKALTGQGIGIGSAKADVLRAYADFESEVEEGFFEGEDVHIVGSVYGGMIFTFKDGKVSEIFLGAAAE